MYNGTMDTNNRFSISFGITDALMSLTPGAQWVLRGDEYSGLEWLDEVQVQPDELEINNEIKRLQSEYDKLEYQRLRRLEYPEIEKYIDGVVKGDQSQVDEYISECLAVKAKYPKPIPS